MKPQGKGLTLEGHGEMLTAATALEFTLDTAAALDAGGTTPALSEKHLAYMGKIASNVRSTCTLNEAIIPGHAQIGAFNHHIAGQYGGEMVRGALSLTVRLHPDELVRQSAQDMLRSYEEAVFNDAMGNPTPEA